MNKLDIRTAVLLRNRGRTHTLLLRRSLSKKLLPGLLTGVGGKVEPLEGELDNILASLLREAGEEAPQINWASIPDLRPRLITHDTRSDNTTYVIYWYTGTLTDELTDFSSSEGKLEWCEDSNLPLSDMTLAASAAIPFVLNLPADDIRLYDGILFKQQGATKLLTPR
ncbi:MAG: NUDIX domain-containing protein [Proteobacteria bacterium]|nr:NUDIX domain-containing protein [Pseudomonadota bacterium]